MRQCFIILTFILVTFISVKGEINVPALFKSLRDTETEELMKIGARYDLTNQPDSALVCYSLVNERLSEIELTEKEQKIYCRALTNLGFLYASYYFDYTKVMSFFQKSNAVSEEIGYTANIAYNYLNMAGVYLACNQIYRNQLFEDEIWEFSEQGVRTALDSKEWEVALACMTNAGLLNLQNRKPRKFLEIARQISAADIP